MRSKFRRGTASYHRLLASMLVCGSLSCLPLGGAEAQFTVLHAFTGGADGGSPAHTLVIDATGNLYGTTERGGATNRGTVFKLSPDGTETVLYSFQSHRDGDIPDASLVMDEAGNLYGTTYEGGVHCRTFGCGTAFKLAPDGTKTTLYSFLRRRGDQPLGQLILGKSGNILRRGKRRRQFCKRYHSQDSARWHRECAARLWRRQ
jgi:uncharacterized repeat protein (TIGR03803 family)